MTCPFGKTSMESTKLLPLWSIRLDGGVTFSITFVVGLNSKIKVGPGVISVGGFGSVSVGEDANNKSPLGRTAAGPSSIPNCTKLNWFWIRSTWGRVGPCDHLPVDGS